VKFINRAFYFNIKKEIKIFAAGKVVSGFDIFRAISLGADATYSARAMMMAVGCIQALECNSNTCPTGVATQNQELMKGLVVDDKKHRVANYHNETIKSFVELMAAAGIENPDQINRRHVHRRISSVNSRCYDKLYPYIPEGSLLNQESIPRDWREMMAMATADSFRPKYEQIYIEED